MKTSIEKHTKRVVALLGTLNDPDISDETKSWTKSLIRLRMLRIERELELIGEFIDPGWQHS